MTKDEGGKENILAAIRRAAAELGRAPSRGELRRITGVSHYRVLAEFPTLREAVRAAGLEPNPKGEKISTEDLMSDWKRVAEKLGRRPSRAEYVREGRYSAGAFAGRFGSWSNVGNTYHGDTETRRTAKRSSRELTRRTRIGQVPERANHPFDRLRAGSGHEETQRKTGAGKWIEEHGESVLRDFDRVPLAAVPAPVVGMRRVTEEVAQMVVNTLLAPSNWQLALSQNQKQNPFTTEVTEEHGGKTSGDPVIGTSGDRLAPRGVRKEGDLGPSLAVNAPRVQDDDLMRRDLTRRGIKNDRPVMGEPFDRRPMTNAPVNELGVMVLFGMMAAGLGLQVESVQGKFPDCIARRQVAPGKWQYLRIEFEYESKNFKLHGHDPKGCDVIVCWRHNWKDIPPDLEVIELCRLVGW
jgi:hypothetical protein